MKPLAQSDLFSHADYEARRPEFRQQIITLKKRRRIEVGPLLTLVFENRETIKFQIQEMIRVERIFDLQKIQEELDVYNALLPKSGELSATLFIAITEDAEIEPVLDSFQNLDRDQTLGIQIGNHIVYAEFEEGHSKEDKISAVHFIRFRPDSGWIAALNDDTQPGVILLSHAVHQSEAKVPHDLKKEWLKDLSGIQ